MREIDSVKNSYIVQLNKLKQNKYRQLEEKFLIEGYHLVYEALKAKKLESVLISKKDDYVEGVENILVNDAIISKLSFTNSPQGIIGVSNICPAKEFCGKRFLLLDNVQDPGNVGTLIRTAAALDIDMVVLGEGCADLYNDKTIRATQGALFSLPIIQADLNNVIKELKKKSVTIIGTDLSNGQVLSKTKKPEKFALLLGNEGVGVKDEFLKQTDYNVFIEISSRVESLNVAIAGGIILYYLNNN